MNADSREIELQFIREFSVGGNQIGLCENAEDRRERIRVSIYQAGLSDKIFRDSGMTYASAYRLCYGRLLEMRKNPRVAIEVVPVHPDDEDDSDDDLA